MAASQVMVANLLLALAEPDAAQRAALERFAMQTVKNVRGFEVGRLAGTEALRVSHGRFA
jgi:L-asparaginase II